MRIKKTPIGDVFRRFADFLDDRARADVIRAVDPDYVVLARLVGMVNHYAGSAGCNLGLGRGLPVQMSRSLAEEANR